GLRVLRAALPRRRPAPQGPARDLGGTRRHAGGKGRAAVGHADRARPARRVLRCPAPALARAERARVTGSDSTAEIYDRAAQNWRRCAPVLLADFTARPFVLDWCEPVGGCEVLDLGCGEGYVARQLKRRRAARVRGTDVSGEMIARALEEEEREPLGIEYRVGDARDLSWVADGSVDLAVAVFLFNYLDRAGTAAVMSEVHRVLRPGGRFVFAVPHPSLPFLRPEEPPFYFARAGRGYFSARDATLEGRIWRRDGIE